MTAHSMRFLTVIGALAIALAALPVFSAFGATYEGPARYPVTLDSPTELMRVFAAGLAGDVFGYDANEILYQVRAAGMPTNDIVPTFSMAYLGGKSFQRVIELRAKGQPWGQIAATLGVDADALNHLAIPREVQLSNPGQVADNVYQDMFVCSALVRLFRLDPEEIFSYYQAGWNSLDVMASAEIAARANQPLSAYLSGSPRRMDWLDEAQRAGLDLREIAGASGRFTNSMTPILDDRQERADLETLYAMDEARDRWSVPQDTVYQVRSRYLYSPEELVTSFYLANLGHCDYWDVGRRYAWDHWRHWGPAIVDLRIPVGDFGSLNIWSGGVVDFGGVDPYILDGALLGAALAWGTPYAPDFYYSHFDSWFSPCDAILYCGVYDHYRVPFDDYYRWRRSDRPWHEYDHFRNDYGNYQRSLDWVGNRRVGAIIGQRQPVGGGSGWGGGFGSGFRQGSASGGFDGGHGGQAWGDRGQGGHNDSNRRNPAINQPGGPTLGAISGNKSWNERTDGRNNAPGSRIGEGAVSRPGSQNSQPGGRYEPDRRPASNAVTSPTQPATGNRASNRYETARYGGVVSAPQTSGAATGTGRTTYSAPSVPRSETVVTPPRQTYIPSAPSTRRSYSSTPTPSPSSGAGTLAPAPQRSSQGGGYSAQSWQPRSDSPSRSSYSAPSSSSWQPSSASRVDNSSRGGVVSSPSWSGSSSRYSAPSSPAPTSTPSYSAPSRSSTPSYSSPSYSSGSSSRSSSSPSGGGGSSSRSDSSRSDSGRGRR